MPKKKSDENKTKKELIRELEKHVMHLQAEKAIKASERKYQDLYDYAPDMFVSVDAKTGNILQCNQTTLTALGYSKDEIIGRHISEMYHPDCEEDRKVVFKTFVEKGEVRNAELKLMRKDGDIIEVSLNITAVRDEQGKIVHSRSIWRDITDFKRVREEMRKFKTISDRANYGIAIADLDGVIEYVNQYFASNHGYSRNELIGKNLMILYNQDQQEQARKLNRRLMEDGEYNLEEVCHTHRNGSVFPMLMCGILVKEDTGEPLYIACTAVNISEKKILQDHLIQSERLAVAGQLASSIAHEINSPLQGIFSILDSLQETYKDQAARRQPIITP
jgi:PAS domain S-box-containing protein